MADTQLIDNTDLKTGLNLFNMTQKQLESLNITEEQLQKISEPDKSWLYYRAALVYMNGINSLDRAMMEMEQMVRMFIPTSMDKIKIVLSRIEDINEDDVDDLSTKFVNDTFTIDGEEVPLGFPEVGEYNETEFKREVIKNIMLMNAQVNEIMEYRKLTVDKYNTEIPDKIKEVVSNIEKGDEFVLNYFREKLKSPEVTDEMRKEFEKRIRWKEYGKTIQPIYESIKNQTEKRGGSDSIIHGFRTNNEQILEAAVQVASGAKIVFPFKMFIGIEEKMFGDKYSKYRNLFLYLLARYIKYHKDNIDEYMKLFLTDLHATLVILNRPKAEEKYPELYEKMKNSIERIIKLVVR